MKNSRKVLSIMLAVLMAVSCLGQMTAFAAVTYKVTFIDAQGEQIKAPIDVTKDSYVPEDEIPSVPYNGEYHDNGDGKHSIYYWDADPATTQIKANTVFTIKCDTNSHSFDFSKPNFTFSKENSRGIVSQYTCAECGYVGELGVEFTGISLNGLDYKVVGSAVTGGDGTAYEGTANLSDAKKILEVVNKVVPIPQISTITTILDVGQKIIDVADEVKEKTSTCAKQGHLYADNPTYSWNENHTECVALFTCTREDCESHYDGHTTEVALEVTGHHYEYPDCENDGKVTHTAMCLFSLGDDLPAQKFETEDVEFPKGLKSEGHKWGPLVSNNDASCLHDGTSSQTCSVCGKTRTADDAGTQKDHTKSAPITVNYVAPTCTQTGTRTVKYLCTMCGEEKWERETTTLDALEHDWSEPTVENYKVPSCETGGSYERVSYCNNCGERKVVETVTVDPTEHVPGDAEQVAIDQSTCTSGGTYKLIVKCTKCGKELSSETVEGETASHVFSNVQTIEPTCEEDGKVIHTCVNCGYSYSETLDATDHDFAAAEYVEPTCSELGYTVYECSKCHDSYIEYDEATPLTEHTFGEWEVTTEPTCEGTGERTRICTVCGEIETKPISALKHDYKNVVTQATCTQYGYSVPTCTRCGAIDTQKIVETAPTGHTEGKPVRENEVEPTCTEEGSYDSVIYCANEGCGVELRRTTVTKKKLEHNADKVVHASTCTVQGYTEYTCKDCHEEYVGQFLPCKEHTKKVESEEIAATCTESGTKAKIVCSVCNTVLQEADKIPALGHTPVTDPAIAPTCTQSGHTEGIRCAVCDEVIKEKEVIPATGHKLVTDKAVAPTFEKAGKTAGSHCSVCGVVATPQKAVAKLVPSATTVSKLKGAKKQITVTLKKQTKNTTGYEIQLATDSKFKKNKKTVIVPKNKTIKTTVKKLKAKKKYYVRVRTYKTVGKKKYYSSWSKAKTVKTK